MRKECLLLLALLFLFSCSQDNELTNEKKSIISSKAEGIGKFHSGGLDFFRAKFQFSEAKSSSGDSPVSIAEMINSAIEYMNSTPEYRDFSMNSEDFEANVLFLESFRDNTESENIQKVWSSLMNGYSSNFVVSSIEKDAIHEIEQIFEYVENHNMSTEDIYTYIRNSALTVLTKYSNRLANEPYKGELFLGLVDICLDSNDYWYRYNNESGLKSTNSNQDKDEFKPGFIIQIDCIGYLYGWIGAVFADSRSPGGVRPDGQWGRIGAGVVHAVSASTFALYIPMSFPKEGGEIIEKTTQVIPIEVIRPFSAKVYSVRGQLVYSKDNLGDLDIEKMEEIPLGSYIVQTTDKASNKRTLKVVKQ